MNGVKCIYALLLFSISSSESAVFRSSEQDALPSPTEFAKSHGYYAEDHTIVTPDGYYLTAHRILSPKIDFKRMSPEPFILQHGLTANSAQWILLDPPQGLAFLLADKGFDVWLTNIRGNMYSRKHASLSPSSSKFWDYSWHEHGVIDMPAIIDYILNLTKHKQVWYSGHSMGTTMFFVMTSVRPEYNKKIKHYFALAPVAYMSHMKSEITVVAQGTRQLLPLAEPVFNNHFSVDFVAVNLVRYKFCDFYADPCAQPINVGVGFNPRFNATPFRQGAKYMPDVVAVGQAAHYGQLIPMDFTFRMYDYYEKNMEKYNSTEPPDYIVERITAPMTLIYSANDKLVSTVDVEKLSERLKYARLYLVSDKNFNHFDFITSTYADEILYKPIMDMIAEFRADPEGYFRKGNMNSKGSSKQMRRKDRGSISRLPFNISVPVP